MLDSEQVVTKSSLVSVMNFPIGPPAKKILFSPMWIYPLPLVYAL